ncbi:MAG: molybdopterin-synthase adenylyltransferase MoeB [Alcanivorax sp.]|uniref:HesA/MoeB/ThiF family protein n=1 Tax=Alcanivorax sp. TaxID=1872427 RepID=UPI0019C516C7|nr:molybdopterin-synthase adenylyltransferase MoeB [Alcanivorax sp.]MBD3644561.1 molybdopterin-synthase adenylyltransferase MoeB [Alcanivorax sp.]MDF1723989.1 molybdopterin-synthase adenylyltransferase MoeB [Alcanivorax sp.]
MLNDDQLLRYSRQLMVEEFDLAGQEALAGARVLVVGCGGLANPAALYLAGAGVGELVLADDDAVELSNLHRQVAFRGKDVGQSKAEALKAQLQALNSDVSVQAHTVRVDADWLDREVASATVVLDCTDNFATRQSINQACVTHRTPLVSGAAIRMDGQLAVFDLRQPDSACYACVYGDGTDGDLACSQAGIVGPVVGIVGTLQALAAMQVLLGNPMPATLRLFDGRTLSWREMRFHKDPACPVCSRR